MTKETLLIFALIAIAGCVTPTVTQKPVGVVDFKQFKTVSYKVHDNKATDYRGDLKYGTEVIDLTEALLGKRLAALNYQVITDGSPAELMIDVDVMQVRKGSPAARFWVGFGAGRAMFLFDATFKNSDGREIASFQGGRSYTGMEFGNSFAGNSEIGVLAATRSVDQIEVFIRNGGTFPPPDKQSRTGPGTN